jgi:hypothetical protein
MTHAQQMQRLLVIAKEQVRAYDRLSPEKKKAQAARHLKDAGILTPKGKLAVGFA